MKILLLGNDSTYIYNFRKEIILRLLEEGHEIHISTPIGNRINELIKWGCRVTETQVDRRGTNPVKDLKLLLHYIRLLNKIKPDVVLAYTIKPNLYGGIACRLLRIPYINNITGLGSGFLKKSVLFRNLLTFLYKVSLKRSFCIFFQNKSDLNALLEKKIIKNNYELLPGSGVNLSEFAYKPFPSDRTPTFLYIGRIMKDKGIDEYLEAAKIIKTKYPEARFNIIGYVEKTQSHYSEIIKRYEDEGFISYYGYQSNVKPFIEETQCVIQPSHGGEGMSNVLLESAAMGRVLIASDIPGCRETINEDENGFLFEPQNTSSLILKIEKFLELPYEEKRRMGKNSRSKVEREFDRNIVVDAYLKKIKQICC
ncbi:glycosyltransferase family 4 protein [Cohnella laeviribosi]|jgi:galacturonosyltransferase|uniref:glycosyltransferase family 4 protein n=1 Tax=Cohnella laeviribosi TaxID=380174 RepID=UPI0003A8BCD5|nr:glycosyltransferase family 4 protein [Cohnella laeviribosi]